MRFALILLAATLAHAANYQVIPDLVYNQHQQKLDAHVPEGKGPFPAIILVHGGGWTVGHKTVNFITPLFPVLDQTGFVWFTIDYRLAPKDPYPAARLDVEDVVRWVKKNAKQYKVNPNKIALMGESAGAHLVNLVGAKNDVGVAAVVSFYGPIDLVRFAQSRFEHIPMTENMKSFFRIDGYNDAAKPILREASPDTYVNRKTPPFLVIHGTKDEQVPYEQATMHVDFFKKRGIPVELITVPDGVHGVMNWEKDARFHLYKQPMIAWLRKTLLVAH